MMIRITKEFHFEAAHALAGYDGPCSNIHGHSYGLSVTIKGSPIKDPSSPKKGMIMDFGDLKKIVRDNIIRKFDHSLILNKDFPIGNLKDQQLFCNIVYVDYQPTSENLLIDFAERIKGLLPGNISLVKLKLRETASSYAEWYAEDNE
jgi:6-pyruvoyltetrahydropterin/6-carboxytetrahydropterin synthase